MLLFHMSGQLCQGRQVSDSGRIVLPEITHDNSCTYTHVHMHTCILVVILQFHLSYDTVLISK